MVRLFAAIFCFAGLLGCSAIPDIVQQPQYHNPFPQLSRVAVLPFYNQSAEATVDSEQVALSYAAELQAIPGYEVVPVGVAKQALFAAGVEPRTGEDFQLLAQAMGRLLGVDAIVVGSITEFSPYYPPRMGLTVRWYAANPGFHPIPPGYGLPWGTAAEEYIPPDLVFEAEFALAKEQLQTQTPEMPRPAADESPTAMRTGVVPAQELSGAAPATPEKAEPEGVTPPSGADPKLTEWLPGPQSMPMNATVAGPPLPEDWPDPRGFVPPPPAATRPAAVPQYDPVLSHTRLYHSTNADFTRRLADYCYFRDDARFGGWQGYLQRSDDFIRFCCHLHITEMLTARGGAGETRVVWRWPIRRYER
ncbi:MAG: hypothetical protein AB7F89_28170 [Pirellulaceae bacterium]